MLEGLLDPSLARVIIFGQPYHGEVIDGVLTLPGSAGTKTVTGITSGDTTLIDLGLPAPTRTTEEQARDSANGWLWTGWTIANTACLPSYLDYVSGWVHYRDSQGGFWQIRTPRGANSYTFQARRPGDTTWRTFATESAWEPGMSPDNVQAVRPDLKAFLILLDGALWEGVWSDSLGSLPAWSANWTVSMGQHINTSAGYYRASTVTGPTGSTQPTWGGDTVTDGGVTWTLTGPPITLTCTLKRSATAPIDTFASTSGTTSLTTETFDPASCSLVAHNYTTAATLTRRWVPVQMGVYGPDGTAYLLETQRDLVVTYAASHTPPHCDGTESNYDGESLTRTWTITHSLQVLRNGASVYTAPQYVGEKILTESATETFPDTDVYDVTWIRETTITKGGSVIATYTVDASYTEESPPNSGGMFPPATETKSDLERTDVEAFHVDTGLGHVLGGYEVLIADWTVNVLHGCHRPNEASVPADAYSVIAATNNTLATWYRVWHDSGGSHVQLANVAHYNGATSITAPETSGNYRLSLNPRTAAISHGAELRSFL